MDKRSFGTWGLELIAEDFACALAALGVLQHWMDRDLYRLQYLHSPNSGTIDEQLASAAEAQRQGEQVIVGWNVWGPPESYPPFASAREFADAWKRFIPRYQSQDPEGQPLETLQIQITQELVENSFWLVEQLGRPDVGAASVYWPEGGLTREYEVIWNWPLVVGFLPDRASQELRADLEPVVEKVDYVKRLTRFVNLSSGNDTCDLLLLPHDLHAAMATILQSQWQARADCIVVLGRVKGPKENALFLMATLWFQVQTAGMALAHVSRRHHADWFKKLIAELSHNKSLDRALFSASRSLEARVPLLFASRQLVEFSLVSRRIESLKDKFRTEATHSLKMNVSERLAYRLGITKGEHELGTVGDLLDGMIKNGLSYDHESDTASTTAELETASSAALDAVPPPEPQERWIQSKVLDASVAGEPTRLWSAFRANAPHAVFIRIGKRSDEWLAPDADQPGTSFPAHELPAEETSHDLTVVFSEPNILCEPLVDKITLPRSGNSSECKFLIHTKDAKQIEARVIVLHKNRVLQTALLRAPVVANPVEANNSHIELSIEAMVRPGFQDLSARRKFDVALVLNHNGERVAAATAATEDGAAYIPLPDLEKAIEGFDDQLSDIAKDPDKYAGLNNQATVDLLRDFAQNGSLLYRRIIKDSRVGDTIARADRIQVITAKPEARLPLEFLYDQSLPTMTRTSARMHRRRC